MAKITDFNEVKKKKRKRKFTKNFIVLLLFLSISLATAYIFSKYSFMEVKAVVVSTFTNDKADGYPISTPGGKVLDVGNQDGNFMLINETNIYSFSPTGSEALNIQHQYQRPLVSTSGNKTVIYTRGNDRYTIYDEDKIMLSKKLDNMIYNLDVDKNGRVAVCTNSNKGRSKVSVHNKSGDEIFTWLSFDKIAVLVDMDNSSEYVAVGSVFSEQGEIVSNLTILKTNNKKYTYDILFKDELILDVKFKGKNIEVITDSQVALFSKECELIASYSFENQPLTMFSYDDENTVLLLGNFRHNRSYKLVCLSNKYEDISEIKLKEKVLDLKVGDSIVYILENNNISCYDTDGNLLEKLEANDVYEIEPIYGSLYTLSQNSIKKINSMLISTHVKGGE